MKKMFKLSGALATSALIASMIAPAAFAATVNISGNGAKSSNSVWLSNSNTTNVSQTNVSSVTTSIGSSASTGGNKANGNTGGDVSITTGDATSNVGVSVTGGGNEATLPSCLCDQPSDLINISDNGYRSRNHVGVRNRNRLDVDQTNISSVDTTVWSKAKTGKNTANHNTDGTTSIDTGWASSNVFVEVVNPSNTLNP